MRKLAFSRIFPYVLPKLEAEVKILLISLIRSTILYLLLILGVRLMGKRQLGEMEPSEFVMTMLLANLAAIPMQDSALPLLSGLVPILTVFSLELVLAFLNLKSIRLRKLLCGKPIILINNGVINQQGLRVTRITVDELTEHLRENGVMELDTVKYAILETNGKISTFLYGRESPPAAKDLGIRTEDPNLPFTLISDGRILHDNLKAAGRDRRWLDQELSRANCSPSDVFLLTVDSAGKTYLVRKDAAS